MHRLSVDCAGGVYGAQSGQATSIWIRLVNPILLLALAGHGTIALAAQSGQRPDTAIALPVVIVTATREPANILTTPLAVTKIGSSRLRSTSGYGIAEALRLVPGVIAQSRYGSSDVRLMIRGFGARGAGDRSNAGTSRGIRVLIDGFPETEPDGRTSFDQIDLDAAEEVEVIRSNASSVWGNASGGVVNVLTVPPVDERRAEVETVVGGFGLRRYVGRAAAPIGPGTTYISFTNSTFGGWRQHSDARRTVLNAGLVGSVGERTRLGIHLVAANNLIHIPGPLTMEEVRADPRQANGNYASRDERRFNRVARIGLMADHDLNATTSISSALFVNPKYLQRSERNTFRDFTRLHAGGSIVARKELVIGAMRSRLSLGMEEAYQDGAILFYDLVAGQRGSTLLDNKSEGASNSGVFLQDELHLSDRLMLLLGARYDNVSYDYESFLPTPPVRSDSRRFDRVSPKIGFSWRFGDRRSLYGNLGGGVEVPAGNETDPAPGPVASSPALINPLLDAINSTTYELGFKSLPATVNTFSVGYDVALYDIEVQNEIIPYSGGRYYATAARSRRSGAEVGLNASTSAGVFGGAALTLSRNSYVDYVVDSAVINPLNAGKTVDLSGKEVVGLPRVIANVELGAEVPAFPRARVRASVAHSASYFADDANKVAVPSFTILDLSVELRQSIVTRTGWGLRGFVTLHNVTDSKYIGSAFLNPDNAPGSALPAAYEPGMPRSVILSLALASRR